jgi:hypothetical protein
MDDDLPAAHSRHPLLPDLERSRAVLVGAGAGLPPGEAHESPADAVGRLAEALSARPFHEQPVEVPAFHAEHVTVLADEGAARVLDAVGRAAGAASDVLLVHYAGWAELDGDALVLGTAGGGVPLAELAAVLRSSAAARPVLVLDCEHTSAAPAAFDGGGVPVLAAGQSSFRFPADPFTAHLVTALRFGVFGGPEVLDLTTLRDAVEAAHVEGRRPEQAEWLDPPVPPVLLPGPEVALGVNVAARRVRIRGLALPRGASGSRPDGPGGP